MKLDLQTTYIAARDIPPRTKLESTDLIETRIPNGYLLDNTYNMKEEIIGKYTEIQGMIPAGSVFYRDMLYSEESLPDYPSIQLKEGQAAYTLETDLARLGGDIIPGQRVDIYVSIDQKMNEAPITGCLLAGARVISIKDHKGLDLSDPASTGIPYLAILAVNTADLELLSIAESMGSIRLFSSSISYNQSIEAMMVKDTILYEFLSSQQRSLSEEVPIFDFSSEEDYEY
ncbi:MAG: Flp pilus assembly protein CpaB [Erysipelotrichia bacterium]|nr:Flp pilus assembly protein CpaB [Erysipelotrichia bacterium]